VERVAKRGPGIGKAFYGCSRYPRCTQTMPG
jgi:ssDNA-binding Zn-finger/Zn-ribbon topoisomerase 1